MCQCKSCGEKKWSHRRKKVNKALSLTVLNLVLWSALVDGCINWYEARGHWDFENTAVVAVVHAREGTEPSEEKKSTHTDPSVVSATVAGEASSSAIEAKIRAAFPEDQETAVAVAKCESQMEVDRIGDTDFHKPSVGLFQINQYYHPYSTEYLKNPDNNIKVAKEIKEKGGWNRWSCFKFGYYLRYM